MYSRIGDHLRDLAAVWERGIAEANYFHSKGCVTYKEMLILNADYNSCLETSKKRRFDEFTASLVTSAANGSANASN
jgi:hypothetical protein